MTYQKASSDKILYILKTKGPQTSKMLAESLNMTSMGARQHLLQLEEQHLVDSYNRAEKVGRPSQYWQLTEKAQARFPDTHGQLTINLLQSVRSVFGDQGLDQLIAKRESDMQQDYLEAMNRAHTAEEKLTVLAELRNREGYMAQWSEEESGGYWFLENHCPICAAASECQNFCQSELALFQTCLGPQYKVTRKEHILQGARRCAYLVEKAD